MLLCSGKIYYDLLEKRGGEPPPDVALVRMEQLYPFPARAASAALEPLPRRHAELCWVQEEPGNMGAGPFLMARFRDGVFDRFPLQISRGRLGQPGHRLGQRHQPRGAIAALAA